MTEDTYANRVAREALRDQFAAAALTGLLMNAVGQSCWWLELAKARGITVDEAYAEYAYACADPMLARRAQPTAPSTAQTAP